MFMLSGRLRRKWAIDIAKKIVMAELEMYKRQQGE